MISVKRAAAGLAALPLSAGLVRADVKPASVFGDHMVLQQSTVAPVWGTASPGEKVTVTFGPQKKTASAGADGKWMVRLAGLKAGGPFEMTIAGNNTITFRDVYVGEVWLCSGQSNMDFTVARTTKYYFAGVNNEEQEVAAANYPKIRMFTGEWTRSYQPKTEIAGAWKVCTPENVREFSAVGYFFARDLQKELDVPVGIITMTYGASTAQAWIRREALVAVPEFKPMLEKFDASVKAFSPEARQKAEEDRQRWQEAAAQARAEGKPAPRAPRNPDPVQDQHNPTVMFNGMIAPVIPYGIGGVLWYQGESIVGGVEQYPLLQSTLIKDWRQLWDRGDLPFYIVQLAAHKVPATEPGNSSIATVREAQATVLSLPNTGMAVTIDIGDAKNVHPKNKQDVGERLARIALAKTYGRSSEYSGPLYESFTVEGSSIRLKFSHVDGGLVAKGGPLKQFAIAGADGKFVWADAMIDKDTVVVRSPQVSSPVAVRYAWADNPEGANLYNTEGLPAVPFRTNSK